jgi:hypothetical protein
MPDLTSLVGGGLKSFGVDKLSENLSPQMRELLPFAINPQGYLVGKAVNSLADYLGYGNQVKDLQSDAKAEKDYFKETMRDAAGNVLPGALGDFVRATPKETEPYDPYNGYYAQNIGDWVNTRESTPESLDKFENFVRNENYGTQTPGQGKHVGPLPEDNPLFESNVSNLPYELKSTPVSGAPDDFDPALLASILRGDSEDTGQLQAGDQFDPNIGMAIPSGGKDFERGIESNGFDGGGGKYMAYAKGGQTCGCKH